MAMHIHAGHVAWDTSGHKAVHLPGHGRSPSRHAPPGKTVRGWGRKEGVQHVHVSEPVPWMMVQIALREAAINATLDHPNIVRSFTYEMQPLGEPLVRDS